MTNVNNIHMNIGGYFELSFVMVEVGNLHAKSGGYFMCFRNGSDR